MAQKESQTLPLWMMLVSDFMGFIFSIIPVTGTYATLLYIGHSLYPNLLCLLVYILLLPYIGCLTLIIWLVVIKLPLPKMRPGVFRTGPNKGFIAWYCNFLMARALTLSGLSKFMMANSVLRFLYLRGMGAKVPYQMTGSMGISITDFPLIEVGTGSTLSENVLLAAHTFTGESVFLAPVKIGKNVFLGMDVVAGPGTQIGEGSWIGGRNTFMMDKIPAGSMFPNHVWERGNPQKLEKSEARLGPLKTATPPPKES